FALTFDDGPSPRNTPALLDALERHRARATFFVMASRARRHAELVRRAAAGGPAIRGPRPPPAAPRGPPPPPLPRAPPPAPPRHSRAPCGLLFPAQARWARGLGLTAVLGSIYPRDHAARSPAEITERVLPRLAPGAIVILHDSAVLKDPDRSATVAAVEAIL